jgi:dolichyl-phosphate-mannose--protein O-mannosyl transferase
MQRPLLMFQGSALPAGMRSVLVAVGNPAIWWVIPIAVFAACFRREMRRDVAVQFTLLAFTTQLAPWFLVTRSTFIYHFLPSSLMGMVLIAHIAMKMMPKYKPYVLGYAALVVIGAVAFSPLIFGFEVGNDWIQNLKWFQSWSF